MKLLITGGAGFLGARLARQLLARGQLDGQPIDTLVLADQMPAPADLAHHPRVQVLTGPELRFLALSQPTVNLRLGEPACLPACSSRQRSQPAARQPAGLALRAPSALPATLRGPVRTRLQVSGVPRTLRLACPTSGAPSWSSHTGWSRCSWRRWPPHRPPACRAAARGEYAAPRSERRTRPRCAPRPTLPAARQEPRSP